MFVCTKCGHLFEETAHWEERHGFDYGPFEQWSGCPVCGDGYVEAKKCDCCDEWITDVYIKTEDGVRYCSGCYQQYDIGDED